MSQVTIYLDNELDKTVRRAARKASEPTSQWIAEAIRMRLKREWPADVLAILGSWPKDFPESSELRAGLGEDAPRESL